MKIGYDAKRLFCNFTGLGNYSRTLLANLGDFYPDNEYFLYTPNIKRDPETRIFLETTRYNTRIPETFFKSYWRSYSIKNQLKSENIQLYHGLSHEIPVNIDKTGIKSVVTIHDLIFKVHPETYSAIDRKIYDLKFRYACRHSDRIIAISENTKRDIVRFYEIDPAKIDVIYQACNPIFYKPIQLSDNKAIINHYNLPSSFMLSVGSVEKRKNLKAVIESLALLKPDLRLPLVVVGKGGDYKIETVRLVQKYGLEKWVIWIDRLAGQEHLHSICQNAKILIYPSYYEGFGLPVAEALLCRIPVITSERSSLKEAGGPASVYVNPERPEEITNGIEKILTDSAFRQNMVDTGYLYAHQTFSPTRVTGQVMDCYKLTLG